MAKNLPKSGGPSRIRVIMVDAVIDGEHDLNSVITSLSNAFKPAAAAKSIAAPRQQSNGAPTEEVADSEVLEDEVEDVETVDVTPKPARPKTTRKAPKAPDIVPIEMNEPVSFADYVTGKKSDSIHRKYLLAAAWLHECRNTPIVTDGHIYTCFRSIGWSTAHADFGQPLRELKGRKFFTTPERGQYEINHIGLDYVKKGGNGTD